MLFVRFQAAEANHRGVKMGVFGLVGALSKKELLTEEQEGFRRESNAWYDAAYTTPTHVDPLIYDHDVNPGATAWFKETAVHLIERVDGYLAILAAHGVPCERVESATPGMIIYEDADQVIVLPSSKRDL